MFPTSQSTFTEEEILKFANEEMLISQVPQVMSYHQEYYVYSEDRIIQVNKDKYEIPSRAIGARLRDVMWKDSSGNLFEMTRIDSGDKAHFQRNSGTTSAFTKFYLENNDVVLTPTPISDSPGSLVFFFYLRPNVLVKNDRAATLLNYKKNVVVGTVVAGDTLTIGSVTFTAVAGAPSTNQFQIGGTSVITATNLNAAINTNGTYSSSVSSSTVSIIYTDVTTSFSTLNTVTLAIQSSITMNFDTIPSNITNVSYIDFLQTNPGHKIKKYDILIPSGGISGTEITLSSSSIPTDFIVGDYICTQYETIIPQLPTDLHGSLVERTCARILAALGDQTGLAIANQKISENEQRHGTLIDARVDGAPQKITNRKSILRYTKMGSRGRRF
jgi:hypothetical protein